MIFDPKAMCCSNGWISGKQIRIPLRSDRKKVNSLFMITELPQTRLRSLRVWQAKPGSFFGRKEIKIDQFNISDRLEVKKIDKLAMLVSPPNRDVLMEIIEKADPAELYLFNLSSIDDSFNSFMKKLIGLLNYCISHKSWKNKPR